MLLVLEGSGNLVLYSGVVRVSFPAPERMSGSLVTHWAVVLSSRRLLLAGEGGCAHLPSAGCVRRWKGRPEGCLAPCGAVT